nr:von Willebrand factor-like [Rhipicephalus microplus]
MQNTRMQSRYVIIAALLAVLLVSSTDGRRSSRRGRFKHLQRLIEQQLERIFDSESGEGDGEPWSPGCQRTEVYDECGSLCPRVCGEPVIQECSQECVVGCVCRPGYILAPAGGGCIPEAQCNQWLSTRGY